MEEARCTKCCRLYEKEELLQREDNGELVCPDCSGLLDAEDLSCEYDETG